MKPKTLTRAAVRWLLLLASASAQADLASVPANADLSDATSAWSASAGPHPGTAFALAGSSALADGSKRATASAVGSLTLPDSSNASLWTFITSVRAQQRGDTFSVLETNLTLVLMAESLPPSQVPLPAAAWFLVMGLLGIAGVRLTGSGSRRSNLSPSAQPAMA